MRVAFLGFGLVAGSIARALRREDATPDWPLVAWSPSGDGPRRAVAEGVLDASAASPAAAIEAADLIVLAGPATACLDLIGQLGGPLATVIPAGAVVTDVASTKAPLLQAADAVGLRYVGGHPMAGRDAAGYGAAQADLFVGRPWVVVPGRVRDLAEACEARPVEMDAEAHDRAVAGISHLPLIVAVALVEAVAGMGDDARPDWAVAQRLAATGWRDMTRLARGDPAMGAAIAATNAEALATRLRDLAAVIDDWIHVLERAGGPDEADLADRLAAARDRLVTRS